jgi:tetratricopeptide (TPR) repeat protein
MTSHGFSWKCLRPAQARGMLLCAMLLLCAGPLPGETACEPALSMKAQFQGDPKTADYNALGVWFANRKQYACAAETFATSLQMDAAQPDLVHVIFMFGVSLYFSGNITDAIASLREAERLGYHAISLHVFLATSLDESHSIKEAEEEWRATLALDPASTMALDALSGDLFEENDFNGIIALLEKPRLLGQRTEQQSLHLGLAYARTARLEDAAATLRDGLNTFPGSLALAKTLATVLVQLHHQNEAGAVLYLARLHHPAAIH